MPITNEAIWKSYVDANTDPYGKCCVDVARKVMDILDAEPGKIDAHKLICRADDDIKAGGITGFMAGCVASMVSQCHSRGDEFRAAWNKSVQLHDEGDQATANGTTLNPALMNVSVKS